jgi:cyclopropane-fatty-acyl-phospholipid synthase
MRNQLHSAESASQSTPGDEMHADIAATRQAANPTTDRSLSLATDLLTRLFRNFPGSLSLRLWNGAGFLVGQERARQEEPAFTLVFRNPGVVAAMVLGRDPLRIAEAFFRGDIDIEGNFFAAMSLKDHLQAIRMSPVDQLSAIVAALRLRALGRAESAARERRLPRHGPAVKKHSKAENRDAIQFHYDVSNEFYALWLDPAMVYSCAYFEQPDYDLERAQRAKLDHICRKLRLLPGERFLDVGCGWGALVMHAARQYGVRAHGITLSRQQLDYTCQRIAEAGLQDRVTVELCDYRDLPGESRYDKIASIGMFEHVGLANLGVYFSTVRRLLRPAGLFLNHGITHEAEGWNENVSTEFINRYVFPDGELDTIGNIQRAMEQSGFEIADVEALRAHYALTLRAWVARLERNRERALQHVNESTYRVWRLYMSACAVEFESGEIGVYQVLASRRWKGAADLPMTRRYQYPVQAGAGFGRGFSGPS